MTENPRRSYVVGGAVRDRLLGLPAADRDWVVTGSTPTEMLAAGFTRVGVDFPVFLHPETHEEYALARTERKTASGYHGFEVCADPSVTLEQDLQRRDLTINAIAERADGSLIDPWGGQRDLEQRVLRHVSAAFVEDPVRILRTARLAARFPAFSVAPETLALMRAMVDSGEVDALVPERVWQELARGLMTQRPSRMLEVLRACGALARVLPEVDRLWGVPQRAEFDPEGDDTGAQLERVLDMAARLDTALEVRFACLVHDLGKAAARLADPPLHLADEVRTVASVRRLSARLRVPNGCRELAETVAREQGNVHRSGEFGAAEVLGLIERCDGLRRPERFAELLLACECDARGRLGHAERPYPQRARLEGALAAVGSRRCGRGGGRCRGCGRARPGDRRGRSSGPSRRRAGRVRRRGPVRPRRRRRDSGGRRPADNRCRRMRRRHRCRKICFHSPAGSRS